MTHVKSGAAVFLDRDGTLIRDIGYLRRVDDLEVLPRVPEALVLLREQGFKLVLVTNQSAIARGWLSETELADIHAALSAGLARRGASVDAIYYCPHHPLYGTGAYKRRCSCRKPGRGMIDRAIAELGVDPGASYVVGDQQGDVALARRIGATAVLIAPRQAALHERETELAVADDLWNAAQWIIADARRAHAAGEFVS